MRCDDCGAPLLSVATRLAESEGAPLGMEDGAEKCRKCLQLERWWRGALEDAALVDMSSFLRDQDNVHWWSGATLVTTVRLDTSPSWREATEDELIDANTLMLRNVSSFLHSLGERTFPVYHKKWKESGMRI